MANPSIQDSIFDNRFGSYANKYGASGAASMWFTGRPSAPNAKDVLGTSGSSYVQQFNANIQKSTVALSTLSSTTGKAAGGLGELGKGFSKAGSVLSQVQSSGGGGGLLGTIAGGLSSAFSGTKAFSWLSANPGGFIGLYGDGGRVSGAGTSTSDSIPAMLSDGEYVVKASAVSKYLPLLEAINDNSIEHRAMGGIVGRVSSSASSMKDGGPPVVYAPVYHIDSRGADQAAVVRMERGLKARDERFSKDVFASQHSTQVRKVRP